MKRQGSLFVTVMVAAAVVAGCGGGGTQLKVSTECDTAVAAFEANLTSSTGTDKQAAALLTESLNACSSRAEWAKADTAYVSKGAISPDEFLNKSGCTGSDASTRTCSH
jgi:hypothetical protein